MRARGSRRHASVRMRAAGLPGGARSTTRRPDSPRLLGDETLRCLLTPDAGGRVLRVRLHDQAVDLGLAIGGEEALDRFSDDVGAGPPRARPVRVEALEELVGELHQGLGASHRHMVAIWGSRTPVCDSVRAYMTLVDETQIHIGPRVRALREAMDLSLRDLAERSGVSAPMLSQVERSETSPTLQIASRIAAGLELRLSQLLRLDEAGTVTVVRAGERRKGGSPDKGHAFEVLTAPLPGQRAELSRHTLAAGARTGGAGDPPMHEPGSREIALVESGRVVLDIDGDRHDLATGDCVTFDADLPHHFENPGPGDAALLAVVSAGLRRS